MFNNICGAEFLYEKSADILLNALLAGLPDFTDVVSINTLCSTLFSNITKSITSTLN